MIRCAMAIAMAVMVGSAGAQPTTAGSHITFTPHWEDTGNHNNILEPGESATLWLDVSFTNQNTVATFVPTVGTFGSGTIRGLGTGLIDLNGSGGAQGTWIVDPALGYGVAGDWEVTGGLGNGNPANGGANLANIQFGQSPTNVAAINTSNPAQSVWRGLWTPSSFAPRTVTFTTASPVGQGLPGSLLFRLSPISMAGIFIRSGDYTFGSVQIPIVPAPGSLVLVVLAALRRRRVWRSMP